jgi:hypothetical protein
MHVAGQGLNAFKLKINDFLSKFLFHVQINEFFDEQTTYFRCILSKLNRRRP